MHHHFIKLSHLNCLNKGLFALLLVVLVAGCASRPLVSVLDPAVLEQRWVLRHAQLSALGGWELEGRVAVKQAQESWSASLRWQQQAEAFDIRFSSMLGQRLAQLTGDALTASLYLPDDRVLSAANVSELLDEELGWSVPMDALRYWLVGVPAPALASAEKLNKGLDEKGRLQWLEQAGWRIEYQRYRSVGALEVPKKMELTRGEIRVRFIIDRWRAVAATADVLSMRQSWAD
ncbi:MAG: lipoprotein insertase outer membrane protein LolB [Gammaproteobacteria bacterium]|nr:lipoprotein insertase outer membrane protein LolB [Gammaproteobacteria bacterium]